MLDIYTRHRGLGYNDKGCHQFHLPPRPLLPFSILPPHHLSHVLLHPKKLTSWPMVAIVLQSVIWRHWLRLWQCQQNRSRQAAFPASFRIGLSLCNHLLVLSQKTMLGEIIEKEHHCPIISVLSIVQKIYIAEGAAMYEAACCTVACWLHTCMVKDKTLSFPTHLGHAYLGVKPSATYVLLNTHSCQNVNFQDMELGVEPYITSPLARELHWGFLSPNTICTALPLLQQARGRKMRSCHWLPDVAKGWGAWPGQGSYLPCPLWSSFLNSTHPPYVQSEIIGCLVRGPGWNLFC